MWKAFLRRKLSQGLSGALVYYELWGYRGIEWVPWGLVSTVAADAHWSPGLLEEPLMLPCTSVYTVCTFPESLGYPVPSPLHSHPSSPTMLSPSVVCCLCSSLPVWPHVASTNIARAAPNPDHTLFSRLCLSACTCHGSLWGTAQTACSALSPAPCFPCDQEHLHIHWSCDLESVCLMCLLLPMAHILSSGQCRGCGGLYP